MRLARPSAALLLALGCAAGRYATGGGADARIDPERARAEVAWLADPAREGRGTGTAGSNAAARFIADRFREAGLVPAFGDEWVQRFDAPFRATLGEGNALALGATAPALGKDFLPLDFSDDGTAAGELVFAGYGITAPDLSYDDYAGLDVKGKIVLVAQDFPRESDEKSPFRDPRNLRYAEWRYKATNAREHGAAAIVGVRDGWAHEAPDEVPPWRGQVSSRAGILAVRTTSAALSRAGVDARALAAPGEEDGRPHSRPLGAQARVAVAVKHETVVTANVAAVLPGRDLALAGECVVVGAHYDHLGLGGDASLAPERLGTVHPGADDNASGVAALLGIARAFAAEGPARRTVLFAAFGAEELGLLGSAHLVKNPPARCRVEGMQLMVNLDMVGRPRDGKVYVDGAETAKGLRATVEATAARRPAPPLHVAFGGGGYGPSDHTSFYARDVPVLFLFTGAHADYHRPSDTADKIDPAGLAAIARLAHRLARDAAERDGRLEVVKTAEAPPHPGQRERGYGSYLGAIPDFAERSEPGVALTGVRPGSPAERAGLGAGDVLLRLGATRLLSLQDLAFALRSHRPGDEVEVEWERAGKRSVAKVRLEERK
ncbi:MAG TPA: M20/M25/M40 family metallo-hydrolase [Anaeromyxobacter sp.]